MAGKPNATSHVSLMFSIFPASRDSAYDGGISLVAIRKLPEENWNAFGRQSVIDHISYRECGDSNFRLLVLIVTVTEV
jgi:hypothetical protein